MTLLLFFISLNAIEFGYKGNKIIWIYQIFRQENTKLFLYLIKTASTPFFGANPGFYLSKNALYSEQR